MNEKIFNSPLVKEKRKKLRNDMTGAERVLWKYLRRRNIYGIKFRRQFSIGIYIVDFYSPQIKLAIEIDGDTHLTTEQMRNDKKRQNEIESLGIEFLRFNNGDVYNNIEGVLEKIKTKLISFPPFEGGRQRG